MIHWEVNEIYTADMELSLFSPQSTPSANVGLGGFAPRARLNGPE